MRYCTTGDLLIHGTIPDDHEGVRKISEYINGADVKITNLETTVTDGDCFAVCYYCDTGLTAGAWVLDEVKKFGFQACGTANNHSLDYGLKGIVETIENLDRAGILHSGTGIDMPHACAPAVIETGEGKTAYIAVGALCLENESGRAGYSHDGIPGRPGVNGLRHIEESLVTRSEMDFIVDLARRTMVNAAEDLEKAFGYGHLDDGTFVYGYDRFRVAEKTGRFSRVNETDMVRTEEGIRKAKEEYGSVIVSLHTHQFRALVESEADYYAEEFAHRSVDAGADAVIMTGNHLLKGIEIYKGRPVFYGLGNFVFQPDYVEEASADMVELLGFSQDLTGPEIMEKRIEKATSSMEKSQIFYLSCVPEWEMKDGKLVSISLLPIELGLREEKGRKGLPSPCSPEMIFDHLAAACEPYGTKLRRNGDLIEVVLSEHSEGKQIS